MENMVVTRELRKVYRIGDEKVVALTDIDIAIEKGQICCILGTSGSGKSTLLNLLAGLERPTSGEVRIRGKNVSAMSEGQLAKFRQRHIGFVFQSYNLIQGMSALENVAMPLMFRGVRRKDRERKAAEMLMEVGLGDRMRHRSSEMSGGQQQRVGIARAFVSDPEVIFADEPTGNLDTRTTREVMRLFLRFAKEKDTTIVLVTHDRGLTGYCDRVITILDGRVTGADEKTGRAVPETPDFGGTANSRPEEENRLEDTR